MQKYLVLLVDTDLGWPIFPAVYLLSRVDRSLLPVFLFPRPPASVAFSHIHTRVENPIRILLLLIREPPLRSTSASYFHFQYFVPSLPS